MPMIAARKLRERLDHPSAPRAAAQRLVLLQPIDERDPNVRYQEVTIERPPNRRLSAIEIALAATLITVLFAVLIGWLVLNSTVQGNRNVGQTNSDRTKALICQGFINQGQARDALPSLCLDSNVLRFTTLARP